MATPGRPALHDQIILREYDQAAAHYRHLESLRAQHLGFLFTVSFAAVAYIASFHHALNHPWQGAAAAGIACLVAVLAAFTYVDVRKMGIALSHNRDIIHGIRARAAVSVAEIVAVPDAPARTEPTSHLLRSRLFTVQGTAELTCLIAGMSGAAAATGLAVHFLIASGDIGAQVVLVGLAGAATALIAAVVAVGDRPYWVGR